MASTGVLIADQMPIPATTSARNTTRNGFRTEYSMMRSIIFDMSGFPA